VDLGVPRPPSIFHQAGRSVLVYELWLRSLRAGEIEWARLEVQDGSGRPLAAYEKDDLEALLSRPGLPPAQQTSRRIEAGGWAVAFLWIEVEGEAPRALRHRVLLSLPAAASGRRVVESSAIPVEEPALVVGPPARGEGWVARWASNTSFHRRTLLPLDGRASISQRFAIDWNRYDGAGVEQQGDASQNRTYSVYGQEILAVADGTVAKVIDGVEENNPPAIAPGVGFDPEKALGNSVVLALPGGLFATYAHMQPRSLRVKTGDRVRRGQVLGLVGNSGNATGPHLHFHISTGPGLSGEGVPYVIDAFTLLGQEKPGDQGPVWNPADAKRSAVHGELPSEHDVVAFPAAP
jgi:murein DD-endopeptidase MepM/ murein hydrolase activator NlpD